MFSGLYLHRGSAGAARGAHNLEVVGSRPTAGISTFVGFSETDGHSSSDLKHEQLVAGMAQRQRARLITSRTQDRSLLPVFIIRADLQNLPTLSLQQQFTGMAQRKRAGLITPRSLVQSQFPVFTILADLQNLPTLSLQQHSPL